VFDAGAGMVLHVNALSLASHRPGPPGAWISEFLKNAYPVLRHRVEQVSGTWRMEGRTPLYRRFHLRRDPFLVRRRGNWRGRWVRDQAADIDYLLFFGFNRMRARLPWARVRIGDRTVE